MNLLPSIYLMALCLLLTIFKAFSSTVGLYAPDRYDGVADMCLMPMDFGHCRAKVKRYYFDMRRMKCTMFYWGGCAGNVNNFKSMDDCNKVCLYAYEDTYSKQSEEDRDAQHSNNVNINSNSRGSSRTQYNRTVQQSQKPTPGSISRSFKLNKPYSPIKETSKKTEYRTTDDNNSNDNEEDSIEYEDEEQQ